MEKKTASQTAKTRTTGKGKTKGDKFTPGNLPCPEWCDLPLWKRLEQKQQLFVMEYLVDTNGTQAAIRAGYASDPNVAKTTASRLISTNANLGAVLDAGLTWRFEKCQDDADMVVAYWRMMATGDANELSELRRVACRHCWGEGNKYQYTPAEFERDKENWKFKALGIKGANPDKPPPFPYEDRQGDWYDGRMDPNPDCPECFGNGDPVVLLKDTRKLSPAARAMYGGVKVTKLGIEMNITTREKALEMMARHRGMFAADKGKAEVVDLSPDVLEEKFAAKMRAARERQEQILSERRGEKG